MDITLAQCYQRSRKIDVENSVMLTLRKDVTSHQQTVLVSSRGRVIRGATMLLNILIVDDDSATRRTLQRELPGETRTAATIIEGLDMAERWQPSAVLLDVLLSPDEPGGIEALHLFKQVAPRSHVIVMSSHANGAMKEAAIKEGAFSFCVGKAPRLLVTAILAALACSSSLLLPTVWTLQ